MRKLTLIPLVLLCGSLLWGDTLILKDGSRHQGTLETTTPDYLTFNENGMRHRYTRSEVQSVQFDSYNSSNYNNNSNYSSQNGQYNSGNYNDRDHDRNYNNQNGTYNNNGTRTYSDNNYGQNRYGQNNNSSYNGRNTMTVPAGTEIAVMTDENIDSQNANEGQIYPAEVQQDVVDASGNVVIPKGSQAELTVRQVNSAGSVSGSNDLALGLDSVRVGNNTYRVSTEDVEQQGNAGIGKNKRTGEYVGGGALLGTVIGAIAGGGKGAAIGAIAGAGAGAGAQVLTRGKAVKVPAETTLRFRLDEPLHLRSE